MHISLRPTSTSAWVRGPKPLAPPPPPSYPEFIQASCGRKLWLNFLELSSARNPRTDGPLTRPARKPRMWPSLLAHRTEGHSVIPAHRGVLCAACAPFWAAICSRQSFLDPPPPRAAFMPPLPSPSSPRVYGSSAPEVQAENGHLERHGRAGPLKASVLLRWAHCKYIAPLFIRYPSNPHGTSSISVHRALDVWPTSYHSGSASPTCICLASSVPLVVVGAHVRLTALAAATCAVPSRARVFAFVSPSFWCALNVTD